jgi:hypothetical protein
MVVGSTHFSLGEILVHLGIHRGFMLAEPLGFGAGNRYWKDTKWGSFQPERMEIDCTCFPHIKPRKNPAGLVGMNGVAMAT